MGTERKNAVHQRFRLLEEINAYGCHTYRRGWKTSASFPSQSCRKCKFRRSDKVFKRFKTASSREKASAFYGWFAGPPFKENAGIYQGSKTLVENGAISFICAGTEPHRVPLGNVEKETPRQSLSRACDHRQGAAQSEEKDWGRRSFTGVSEG